MDKTVWIKNLANNNDYWAIKEMEIGEWPSPIVCDYVKLNELMLAGNVYGALLQMRDLYELSLKIPTLMSIAYMDYHNGDKLVENEKIIRQLIENPLSMGAWDTLSSSIIKNAIDFCLPEQLTEIMKRTRELYRKRVSAGVPNAVNWRNETIGHGALKFEDNEDYQQEFSGLLRNYKEYVLKCGRNNVGYKGICFEQGAIRLIGRDIPEINSNIEIGMLINGERIALGKFLCNNVFFLESFYLRKRNIKYADYYSGEEKVVADLKFAKYIEALLFSSVALQKKVKGAYAKRSEDMALGLLNQPHNYIVPEYLFKNINEFLRDNGKGIVLLSMERGTGKTAFTNAIDGLINDPDKAIIEDAVIRTYSISNAQARGIQDFFGSVNSVFSWGYSGSDNIRASGEELPQISIHEKSPSRAFADFLNKYQEIYENMSYINKIILVIDGIDEVTPDTIKIIDFIPEEELLNEGVYIICTSRFSDEKGVSSYAQKQIRIIRDRASRCIDISRKSTEFYDVLRDYTKNELVNPTENEIRTIIELADYRILYLKVYLPLRSKNIETLSSEEAVFEWYLKSISDRYDEKSYQKMIEFLTTVCTYGEISLKDYFDLVSGDEITYSFIGRLNDLSPVLTSKNSIAGRSFSLANTKYEMYIHEHFRDEEITCLKSFQKSFNEFRLFEYEPQGPNDMDAMGERNRVNEFWVQVIERFMHIAEKNGFVEDFYNHRFLQQIFYFLLYLNSCTFQSTRNISALFERMLDLSGKMLVCYAENNCFGHKGMIDIEWNLINQLNSTEESNMLYKVLQQKIRAKEDVSNWYNIILHGEIGVNIKMESGSAIADRKRNAVDVIAAICDAGRQNEFIELLKPEWRKGFGYDVTYIFYLEELLRRGGLTQKNEEKVLNFLAFSYLMGRESDHEHMIKAKKIYSLIKEKKYTVTLPKEHGDYEHQYRMCMVDTGEKKSELEIEYKRIYQLFFENVNRTYSISQIVNTIKENLYATNSEYRQITKQFLQKCFSEVQNILVKVRNNIADDEDIYSVRDIHPIIMPFFESVYEENAYNVAINWKNNIIYSDNENLLSFRKELYAWLLKKRGIDTESGISILAEYVYLFDTKWSYPIINQAEDDFFISEELKGKILCTDNAIALMSAYYTQEKISNAKQVCEDIVEGNLAFEKMIVKVWKWCDFRVYSHLYRRLYFYRLSVKYGFKEIVDNRYVIHFTDICREIFDALDEATEYTDFQLINASIGSLIGVLFYVGYVKSSLKYVVLPLREHVGNLIDKTDGALKKEMNDILSRLDCIIALYDYELYHKEPVIDESKYEELDIPYAEFPASIYPYAYDFYVAASNGILKSNRSQYKFSNPNISIL